MNFDEYQELSRRTLNTTLTTRDSMLNYGLGTAGEAGEVAEMIKKHAFHGKAMNLADLEIELGDVLWNLAALASTMGLTLEGIAAKNVDKLKRRYPQGFVEGGGVR